jgi:hypothetical protein
MNFNNKFWKWFVAIATILGFVTGGLALYDKLAEDPNTTIRQDVSPELKEKIDNLGPGETMNVIKGGAPDGPE